MRFELTIRCNPYNGLANRRLQPLGHPSTDERCSFTANAGMVLAYFGRMSTRAAMVSQAERLEISRKAPLLFIAF
jgi:hypothetical protein